MSEPREATIALSQAQALVLFDFLARFNQRNDFAFADPSEQRVLWDIEAMLEKQMVEPLNPAYPQLLVKARQDVRNGASS